MAPRKKTATAEQSEVFSTEERDAIKEYAREKRSAARGKKDSAAQESEVLAKIAEMEPSDRAMAEKLHTLVTETAPELTSRLWYGMPAYAKDGKVVLFFQGAQKFKTRYATLGFSDAANLDRGTMWPSAYALTEMSDADVKAIGTLVKRAVR